MPPVKKEPEAQDLAPAPDVNTEELARLRRIIEDYEAAEKQRETGAFTGIARCMNPACEMYDTSAPIALVLDVVEHRPLPEMRNLVLGTSEYLRAVDDADLACPSCGKGRNIAPGEPPVYLEMAPR